MIHDKWYALFVVTGREEVIKKHIENRLTYEGINDLRLVIPKRRLRERRGGVWTDVVRTLFPGYILLNCSNIAGNRTHFRNFSGIIRLLSDGTDLLTIAHHEIETIAKLTYNDDVIGYSTVLEEGDRISVIEGPLMYLEGYIQSIYTRKNRAKVILSFLGEQRTVDLGIKMIKRFK